VDAIDYFGGANGGSSGRRWEFQAEETSGPRSREICCIFEFRICGVSQQLAATTSVFPDTLLVNVVI